MARTISSIGVMLPRYDPREVTESLDLLESLGADHVEINPALAGLIANGRVCDARLQRLADAFVGRTLGVTIHAPLGLNFMDDVHADLHQAVGGASIDICAALGAHCMVVHPGWVDGRRLLVERDRLMAMERDGLRALAARAAETDVILALENMPVIPELLSGALLNHGIDCVSVRDQVRAVDHPNLAATIDFSHACVSSPHLGVDPVEQVRALAPVTRHLHLHDSFGRVPTLPRPGDGEELAYGMGDLHLPLGEGSLPWERLLTGLPLPAGTSLTLEIAPSFATHEAIAASLDRARALALLPDRHRADPVAAE
ncbi:sugar phosphate isomerase/epimerase [uncultured Rhodospira sp.]|uniref:sugar phosphate isomerase/epimerase family protein n=1 Tax=uncultured Rhodospira sp. TaxID=1936189 RepID=UPI002604EFA8|nr:sugar phosphate isomerase/epimerase [uncultured Rhodospira sp.]